MRLSAIDGDATDKHATTITGDSSEAEDSVAANSSQVSIASQTKAGPEAITQNLISNPTATATIGSTIHQITAVDVPSTARTTSTHIDTPVHGTDASANKPSAGFWAEYYPAGIDQILPLRLADTSVKVRKTVVFDEQAGKFLAQDGAQIIGRWLYDVTKPNVVPISYRTSGQHPHGVGFVVTKTDGIFKVAYLDPQNQPLPPSLSYAILDSLPAGSSVNFEQKIVTEQPCSDNCGPELIEDLAEVITGDRVPAEQAVEHHSALLAQHLHDATVTTRTAKVETAKAETKIIIDTAPEKAMETTGSDVPTLHLSTFWGDLRSFMHQAAQYTTNSLWALGSLAHNAGCLLNEILDNNVQMDWQTKRSLILSIVGTVDDVHNQGPFGSFGIPHRRHPSDDDEPAYGGGAGNLDDDSGADSNNGFGGSDGFGGSVLNDTQIHHIEYAHQNNSAGNSLNTTPGSYF